jgi:hypothetical protein
MNNELINIHGFGNFVAEQYDTDSLLSAAASIGGDCSLHKLGSGWNFMVEIPTSVTGGQFKVHSDFGHATARGAIIQCLSRVKEALK